MINRMVCGSGNRFLIDQALARLASRPRWYCEVHHVPALVSRASRLGHWRSATHGVTPGQSRRTGRSSAWRTGHHPHPRTDITARTPAGASGSAALWHGHRKDI